MSAFSFIARGARAALTVLLFDFFALGGLVIRELHTEILRD